MASAWVGRFFRASGHVSIAGFYLGAEVSELGALLGVALDAKASGAPAVILREDNVNCLRHVSGKQPVQSDGWRLYHAILLVRAVLKHVEDVGCRVYLVHVGQQAESCTFLGKFVSG